MKSGENGLIGPGSNDYGRKDRKPNVVGNHILKWISIKEKLPELYKKVIVTDYRVKDKPEYDNQRIDYLTIDCVSNEIKWFNSNRKPNINNEFWMVLPEPPSNQQNYGELSEDKAQTFDIIIEKAKKTRIEL